MTVKIIAPETTYGLRHEILRPHQPLDASVYPADHDADSLHLGAYIGEILVCVASFYAETSEIFDLPNQYRIRGMATSLQHRGKGAGSSLVQSATQRLRQRHASLLWCNARTGAADFYSKLGFIQSGDVFDLPPIGPHKLMYLSL